jgi:hypothetical protein
MCCCVSVLHLLAAMLHVLISVCLRMPAYYNKMFEPTDVAEASQVRGAVTLRKAVMLQSKLTAIGEAATLLGVLSCKCRTWKRATLTKICWLAAGSSGRDSTQPIRHEPYTQCSTGTVTMTPEATDSVTSRQQTEGMC